MSKTDSFWYRGFYCSFNGYKDQININDRPNKRQLDIFIQQNKQLVKVNTIIIPKNFKIEKIKATVENYMFCEIGSIKEDGSVEKGPTDQGYVYKSYENFYKREGKCYVAEYEEGKIDKVGISYEGIYEEVCDYLLLNGVDISKVPNEKIEGMVVDVFDTVDWQHTCSLIEGDNYLEEYINGFPDEYFISGKNTEKEDEELCED